jgi:hypothetical protein
MSNIENALCCNWKYGPGGPTIAEVSSTNSCHPPSLLPPLPVGKTMAGCIDNPHGRGCSPLPPDVTNFVKKCSDHSSHKHESVRQRLESAACEHGYDIQDFDKATGFDVNPRWMCDDDGSCGQFECPNGQQRSSKSFCNPLVFPADESGKIALGCRRDYEDYCCEDKYPPHHGGHHGGHHDHHGGHHDHHGGHHDHPHRRGRRDHSRFDHHGLRRGRRDHRGGFGSENEGRHRDSYTPDGPHGECAGSQGCSVGVV